MNEAQLKHDMEVQWEEKVAGLLRAEVARRRLTHQQIADAIKTAHGIEYSAAAVRDRINRGKVKTTFTFQMLTALGIKQINLEGLDT